MSMQPLPWTLEFIETFPFGYRITDADGEVVFVKNSVCHSSKQKTLEDNRNGVGFKPGDGEWSKENAMQLVAQQEATARAIVDSVNACEGMLPSQLKRGVVLQQAAYTSDFEAELTALREFAATIKDYVAKYPHDMGLHYAAVDALSKLEQRS